MLSRFSVKKPYTVMVGVVLVLFDWFVRDFVLRNRSAFEG